jgi:hypothetical protein
MAGLLVAGGTTSFLRGFFGVFENKKALARSSDAVRSPEPCNPCIT